MSLLATELRCQEAVELVTDYLEGSLRRRTRRRLERHLRACEACSAYLAEVQAVVDTLGRVGPEDLDPTTLEGLVRLYREFEDGRP